ncbi:MAG: cobalamin B12-binding domain-containing protein [Candidatus Schekmanbacteria bacterium]|nr:cobalamin B12-binding domain-containing protein [Candidatus Schekmanbacteria bacterium]
MKVLLINPPNHYMTSANTPDFVDTEGGYNPPLGLLYVAAYLQNNSDHQVEILDALVEEMDYGQIEALIRQKQPDVVGITTLTFTLIDVIDTIKTVKKAHSQAKIVLGGPHVHLFPQETINLPGVDFLVLGEGEKTFCYLMNNIDNLEALKRFKGLVFKENGALINTGEAAFIENLDELPYPARLLTSYKKYSSLMAGGALITTMITSRGCPFKCVFCDRPHLGKSFRARSAQNVLQEMEECMKMGIKEFLVYDDTFTLDRKRVFAICQAIIDRKWDISWDIRTRVNTVDEEMLDILKRAHCKRISYGIEAGTDRVLGVLKKGITIEQTKKVIKMTKKKKIDVLAYFMIGSPSETKEEIMQTIALAQELEPDYVHFSILTPFPGTHIYKEGLQNGFIAKDYWREFAQNPTPDFSAPFWEENFSHDELFELIKLAYKSFYVRPAYIIRKLFQVKSFAEFSRKAKAGLKVVFMR